MKKLFIFIIVASIICISSSISYGEYYWAKTYGGTKRDYPFNIQQTLDGGYIATGYTESFGVGDEDIWILKLDSHGAVSWEKTYGGAYADRGTFIQQTADTGYILMGNTWSFGTLYSDLWMLRLNGGGDILWQKAYGLEDSDQAFSFQQTTDGGYVIAGYSFNLWTEKSDTWILKLDDNGDVIWKKSYIGNEDEEPYSIRQTLDGGYIVAGRTNSFGAGNYDIWLLKIDSSGNVTWQKTFGGSDYDEGSSVFQTSDGGYIVTGSTKSFGAGENDLWLLKLNSAGFIEWQKTYGGSDKDWGSCIKQTTDGEYLVIGNTKSFGIGESDSWAIKLDNNGDIVWQKIYGGNIYYDGFRDFTETTDSELIVVGYKGAFFDSEQYFQVLKLNANGDIPGCNIIEDINVSIAETSIEPLNSTATVQTSSFIITDTSVTPQNTNAVMHVVCCYDTEDLNPPPSGNGIGDLCDCEGNFDCDEDCDGADAAIFKTDFGRSIFDNPCESGDPCNGDFDCDGDVDGTDGALFKQDFGRSEFNNPCPVCEVGEWCVEYINTCLTNFDCPLDSYCEKPIGQCDVIGECVERPSGVCPTIYFPVCGCDGITYSNDCYAAGAGISIDYLGECM